MIRWWRRKLYRNEVLAELMAMTLMIGPEAKVLTRHSGLAKAIKLNFDKGTPTAVAATYLAATLMADAIERDGDTARMEMIEQLLSEWSVLDPPEQRAIRSRMGEGTLEQDMLLTRCQWLLLMGQDMLVDGKISAHDFRMLKDAVYGPLKGEPPNSRAFARLNEALDEAFGRQS